MWRIEIILVRHGHRLTYDVPITDKPQGENFQELVMRLINNSTPSMPQAICVTTVDDEQVVFHVSDVFSSRLYEVAE